jgi:hypothetical protein
MNPVAPAQGWPPAETVPRGDRARRWGRTTREISKIARAFDEDAKNGVTPASLPSIRRA